jgi:epoxyqueuosine reductase
MPEMRMSNRERLSRDLKAEARSLGFDGCGISRAQHLDSEARRLEQWLATGRHASMRWMENHFDKRVDPRRLVHGAKSVISLIHSYYQPVPDVGARHDEDSVTGRVSRYAWGDDYHAVLKEKLFLLFEWLRAAAGDVQGRVFVDSAPVMDKVWAARSGLGWIGKSTMLLNRTHGTFFFIGEMIVDIDLPPDGPVSDSCGSCTRCIDACPTGALDEPYQIDSNRCISYLTIEHRGDRLPEKMESEIGNWIFGCDICQDVCPWNKFKQPTDEDRFLPREGVVDTTLEDWAELDIEDYRRRFKDSAIKRTKYSGLQRNVAAALRNSAGAE